jgi:hypothetical protein
MSNPNPSPEIASPQLPTPLGWEERLAKLFILCKEGVMVLDFLKRDLASIGIQMDRETGYQPGEVVKAHIILDTAKELKVRGGQVVLLRSVRYQVREKHVSYRDGKRYTSTSTSWKGENDTLASQTLFDEMVLPAQFHQDYDFEWQVPPDALPTVAGQIIEVKYQIQAVLDRPKALDISAASGLNIAIPLPGGNAGAPDLLNENHPNGHEWDVDLSFVLPRADWAPGDTIEGKLVAQAHKELKLTDIRVELIQREWVAGGEGNEKENSVVTNLTGSTILPAEQTQTIPFQVVVPDWGLPTLGAHPNFGIQWTLKGVLARRLQTDYHVEQTLRVFSRG